MNTNVMLVFYGTDCLPYKDKELQVHYPIVGSAFQGASQTTVIKFYIDNIGALDMTWVAVAKLPNGKKGCKVLSTSGTDENGSYVQLTLGSWFTQANGDVYISLQGYNGGVIIDYDEDTEIYTINGDAVIQSTGSIKLAINYAPMPLEEDNTTLELIAAISGKLDKSSNKYLKVVELNGDWNNPLYKDYFNGGDIVYSKDDGEINKLIGTEQPFSTEHINITLSNIEAGGLTDTYNLLVNHTGTFNEELNMLLGASYITFGQDGNVSLQDYLDEKQNQIPLVELNAFNGTISPISLVNSLAKFPSYLTYEYGGDKSVFVHCRTDSNYYYFRKLFKESIHDNTSYLIYGGDIYIQVNKSTGVYSQQSTQYTFYSKSQSDTLLNLKADKSDTYTKSEIDTKLTSMLVYKGTKTVAELNTLAPDLGETQTGWFYNVSDSGTLNAGNVEVLAGDNVAWTGSSWDKLTMDLSVYNETFLAAGFLQAGEIDSVPEELEFDSNGDITNPNWTGNIAIDYMSPPITDITISQVPDTLTFDLTQNYDNMITNANWTGIMTITY